MQGSHSLSMQGRPLKTPGQGHRAVAVPLQVNIHTQAERFFQQENLYADSDTQEEYDSIMRGHIHLLFETRCLLKHCFWELWCL